MGVKVSMDGSTFVGTTLCSSTDIEGCRNMEKRCSEISEEVLSGMCEGNVIEMCIGGLLLAYPHRHFVWGIGVFDRGGWCRLGSSYRCGGVLLPVSGWEL